jgi:hypothetical protein
MTVACSCRQNARVCGTKLARAFVDMLHSPPMVSLHSSQHVESPTLLRTVGLRMNAQMRRTASPVASNKPVRKQGLGFLQLQPSVF